MYRSALRFFFLIGAICVAISVTPAQQKFVAHLSGLQALPGNGSARYVLCEATLRPSIAQPNESNLVLLGLGGSSFPPGSQITVHKNGGVGQAGALASIIGFPPEANWIVSFDITVQEVTWLRQNRWYFQVTTPDFPNGEVRGQIKLANGTYNDFDGDGRTDLQVYRNSSLTFFARRSTDGSVLQQQLGQPGDSVSLTVDFDGDGLSDFSTARYNSEVLWRILPSRTNILEETHWGNSNLGDFFAAADYEGDGTTDIAVFRGGVWHILESDSGIYRQEYWGQGGDIPAPADFDRDGTADVTIARSEGGQRVWYTRMSRNGQVRVVPWGLSSDAFFVGRVDFDGDGAADILVIRNEGGGRVFYILRSSDSQLQVIRWGLSSDLVKLGDYDGDGKTDAAITRAENGQRVFYILQSSSGQPRYETFGLAGDF